MPKLSMVEFIEAPYHFGQKKVGVDQAGKKVLDAIPSGDQGRIINCDPVSSEHYREQDFDLIYKPKAVSEACERTFKACSDAITSRDAARTPLVVLGGDHSIAIGSISGIFSGFLGKEDIGLKYKEPIVIWFDAHADINTIKTTRSGNLHGCPVAFLMDHPDTKGLQTFDWFYAEIEKYKAASGRKAFIEPSSLAFIGLRDVEDGEKDTMQSYGFGNAWFMEDIKREGRDIKKIMAKILADLDPDGNRPIHLSFDVDGLDPTITPSTGTPVPDGVLMEEALEMIQILKDTGRLLSVDIVEVNLLLGSEADAQKTLDNTLIVLDKILH